MTTPKGKENIFDDDPGILNPSSPPPGRTLSGPQEGSPPDVFDMARVAGEQMYVASTLPTGPFKARVLKVYPVNSSAAKPGAFNDPFYREMPSNVVVLKARIPELDSLISCPDPINDPDNFNRLVDMHANFVAVNEDVKTPKPGDIVLVDFVDKVNRRGGVLLNVLTARQHTPPMAVPSKPPVCAPASPLPTTQALKGDPEPIAPVGEAGPIARARKAGAKAMIFGDSQSKGPPGKAVAEFIQSLGYSIIDAALGQDIRGFHSSVKDKDIEKAKAAGKPAPTNGKYKFAVHKKGKAYRVFGRSGARPSYYSKSGGTFSNQSKGLLKFIIPMFKKKPDLVVIMLGGNGTREGDPTALVNTIRKYAPGAQILWLGPPSAVPVRGKQPAGPPEAWPKRYPTFKKGKPGPHPPSAKYKGTRESYAKFISEELAVLPNTRFIDVMPLMPDYNARGTLDGVHVKKKGAQELVANLTKLSSQPAGGPLLTQETAQAKVGQRAETYLAKSEQPVAAEGSIEDQVAMMVKQREAQFTTKEKAKSFLNTIASRLSTSSDVIIERDFIIGFGQPENSTLFGIESWEPLTYMEISHLVGQNYTTEENENLIPTKEDTTVYEKSKELLLKITAAQRILNPPPEEPEAPLSAIRSGPGCPSPPEIEMPSSVDAGPIEPVDLGDLPSDFIRGPLTAEKKIEIMKILSGKIGIHWGIPYAIMQSESGGFVKKGKNVKGIGGKCLARLEPHVVAKKLTDAQRAKFPWGKCTTFDCLHWKFGNGWKALKNSTLNGVLNKHTLHRCATYGYAQVFPLSVGNAGLAPAGIGPFPRDAYEYSKLMRESEDAQIRALFAYLILVNKKKPIIEACKSFNWKEIASKYNGKGTPYAWYLENYWKGRGRTSGLVKIVTASGKEKTRKKYYDKYYKKNIKKGLLPPKAAEAAKLWSDRIVAKQMSRAEYKSKYPGSSTGARYERNGKGLEDGYFTGVGDPEEHVSPLE
jgi:lysophospholipase L1-like esterase